MARHLCPVITHPAFAAAEVRVRPTIPPVGVASPLDRTLPDGGVLGRAPELAVMDGQRPERAGHCTGFGLLRPRNGGDARPAGRSRRSAPVALAAVRPSPFGGDAA